MRRIAFHQSAFADYSDWAKADKKIFERIRRIIIETAKTPFDGIGKPEPLKQELRCYWSRRLTDEHRLVYKVTDDISLLRLANTTMNDRMNDTDTCI